MKVSLMGSGLPIIQSKIGVTIPADKRKSKSFKIYKVKNKARDKINELNRKRLAKEMGLR